MALHLTITPNEIGDVIRKYSDIFQELGYKVVVYSEDGYLNIRLYKTGCGWQSVPYVSQFIKDPEGSTVRLLNELIAQELRTKLGWGPCTWSRWGLHGKNIHASLWLTTDKVLIIEIYAGERMTKEPATILREEKIDLDKIAEALRMLDAAAGV